MSLTENSSIVFDTTTHGSFKLPEDVEEEAKIMKVEFYRRSYLKMFVYYLCSILSFGIVALLAKWKLHVRILMKYTKATERSAEYLVVHGQDTTIEHIQIKMRDLFIQDSMKQYRIFNYRLYVYYFDLEQNLFLPIQFLIKDRTYEQLHDEFEKGITSNNIYKQRVLTYGDNQINIPIKSDIKILIDEVLSPFYIFQIFSIILWCSENYVIFSCVIFVISAGSIISSFITIKRNYSKLREKAYFESTVQVYRSSEGEEAKPITISSTFLVPGDIIEIPDNQPMPCDIVLLKGTCVMNESMLTGESIPVIKGQLPRSQKIFDANVDNAYILYSGTKCLETKKNNRNEASALGLVIRTGFSTMKGRLIRSLMYGKPENFKFYKDSVKYIGAMACLAVLCFLFSLQTFIEQGATVTYIVLRAFDIITIAVPPALATCLSIGSEIASNRLEKKGILTKSQTKINVAGKVDVMCFDKTGTLTEDSLDLYGVKPVGKNSQSSVKFLKTVKKDVSNTMNKNKEDTKKTSSHMMLELMATCHSLTFVRGVLLGDPLDLKMFNAIGWNMEDCQENDNMISIVTPPVEIEENAYFNRNSCAYVVKRFDFSAKLQRMSTIIRDHKEASQRIYVKGSPEMIRNLCRQETLPETFDYTLSQYAQNGLRVLACGTKLLNTEIKPLDNLERSDFESDLEFVGFMIFENRLKPATNGVIKKLNDADIKTVMLTGDNPLTAIFISRSCHILEEDKKVMLGVLKSLTENNSTSSFIDWQCIESNKIDNKVEEIKAIAEPKLIEDETLVLELPPINPSKQSPTLQADEQVDRNEHGASQTIQLDALLVDDNIAVAMTGEALSFLKSSNTNIELYQNVLRKVKVFARMRPEEKALVVEEFQKQGYTAGMCGDGANDCPALKAADVGVSLSEAEASIAAPFLSRISDISCIDILLREGRAGLTTSFQCFKYMTAYSFIQTISVIILLSRKTCLSDGSYLYIDLFLILPLAITMSYTNARNKLSKAQPNGSLFDAPVICSIIGQLFLQLIFQLLVAKTIVKQSWYKNSVTLHPNAHDFVDYNMSYDSTALFLMSNFQYIATVLAFSVGKPFRQAFYTNKKFVANSFAAILISFILVFVASENRLKFMDFITLPLGFKWTIIFIALINSVVTIVFEKFVVPCLVGIFEQNRKGNSV